MTILILIIRLMELIGNCLLKEVQTDLQAQVVQVEHQVLALVVPAGRAGQAELQELAQVVLVEPVVLQEKAAQAVLAEPAVHLARLEKAAPVEPVVHLEKAALVEPVVQVGHRRKE